MNKNERYGNGKIYKLVNNVDDEIYIGSTCLPLAKRKAIHKTRSKICPNRKIYAHLNAIGWDNVKIILIEKYPCESKMELEKRERHEIETLKPALNKLIPTRTDREYYYDNKEMIAQKNTKYREENKEMIAQKKAKYREKNREIINAKKSAKILCVCGVETDSGHKARHERTKRHIDYISNLNP